MSEAEAFDILVAAASTVPDRPRCRRLKVALGENDDLAQGTSSRSGS